MFRLLAYISRTITRAPMRSSLTVLGVVVGMVLFGFVRSMDNGMQVLMDQVNQPDMLIVFDRNTICPFQARVPGRYASEIEQMDGVDEVLPIRMFLNDCRANLDLITLYGVPADVIDEFFPNLGVDSATLQQFKSQDDAALVGTRVRDRRGLRDGDTVEVGPVATEMISTFHSDREGFLDNVIFVHLEYLLNSIDPEQDLVTQFLVRVEPNANVEALARQIDERYHRDDRATRTQPLAQHIGRTIAEIEQVIQYAQFLGYFAVAVMAVILMNTVFISAQARRAEFAMLQVLGTTRPGLFSVVMAESMVLSLIGGAIGLALVYGGLTLYPIGIGVEGYQIDFLPSMWVVLEGMVLAAIVGLLAGAAPAMQSAISSVSDALRPE